MAFRAPPAERAIIERLSVELGVSRSEIVRLSVRAFNELRRPRPTNANGPDAPGPPHNENDNAPEEYTAATRRVR